MLKMMFAAPASGTGKTAITCGMLALLKRRGLSVCAFKCGPDYIDPMFHRSVLGVGSYNLDLFFSGEEKGLVHYGKYAAGRDAVVCEGVMGYYDGLGGTTTTASPWHAACVCDFPVILVIRPKGASLTAAAQIRGICAMRSPHHIVGVIFNDCSPMLYQSLKEILEQETGIPMLGYLPHMEEAVIESRHLGLYTAGEITDLKERMDKVADQLEKSVDLERLFALCKVPEQQETTAQPDLLTQPKDPAVVPASEGNGSNGACSGPVIAVAKDDAFCFTYQETLDAWQEAGARLVYFSPLKDPALPEEADALYLPGGYPELYMKQLSRNTSMLQAILSAVTGGLPTVAECGGFLYLGKQVGDEGGVMYPGAGVLSGTATKQSRLVRFGYIQLTAHADSLLFEAGDEVNAHEFHYFDSTENGNALTATKPISGRSWECAVCTETLYAGFPHLYFAANPKMTERFVAAARRYHAGRKREEGK